MQEMLFKLSKRSVWAWWKQFER